MGKRAGLTAHADHHWEQRGRCVYCVPCGARLYQGALPRDRKKFAAAFDEVARAAKRSFKGKDLKALAAKQAERLKRFRGT